MQYAERITKFSNNQRGGGDSLSPLVQFYAVSCTVHRKLCRDFHINSYPSLRLFSVGSDQPLPLPESGHQGLMHPFDLLQKLGVDEGIKASDANYADFEELEVEKKTDTAKSATNFSKKELVGMKRLKRDLYADAHMSLDRSLRELFTSNDALPDETKRVLKRWLRLIRDTIPNRWKAHKTVLAVLANFNNATSDEGQLLKILDSNPPTTTKWSLSCTKGLDGMGYTCGLWQLFHIMSVGLLEWNQNVHEDGIIWSAEAAGKNLRDFIEHFFGCEVCRTNFIRAYDNCELNRCSRLVPYKKIRHWIQFPMWLIETHNAVNLRLARERAEREHRGALTADEEFATQWPFPNDCPKCWINGTNLDKSTVLKHLRIEYW